MIDKQAQEVLLDYIAAVEVVAAPALPQPVCCAPDDDAVLALAISASADLIVSADNDLLVLEQFEGMPIVNTARALALLAPAS